MFAAGNAAKTPKGFLSDIARPVGNFLPVFCVASASNCPEVFKGVFLFVEKKFTPLPLIVTGRRRFFVSLKGRFPVRLAFSCSHKGITFSNLYNLFMPTFHGCHEFFLPTFCASRVLIPGRVFDDRFLLSLMIGLRGSLIRWGRKVESGS